MDETELNGHHSGSEDWAAGGDIGTRMSMVLRVLCMQTPYLGIFLEKSHHFHQITQPVIQKSQEDLSWSR